MSLLDSADGLLGTHVTWQDVESAIQTVYGSDAKFGVNRTVSDIGEMRGFLSKIVIINPDSASVPQLVVKIASTLSLHGMSELLDTSWDAERMKEMEKVVKDFHTRETLMYKIIERESPDCPVIKVLAMEDFEKNPLKAYIISEYLPDLEHIGMHNNLNYEEILPVVDGIAAFSAMGQKMSDEEKLGTLGETYLEEAIKNFYADNDREKMRSNYIKVLGEQYTKKIDNALHIFDVMVNNPKIQKNYSRISEFLGHAPVLQHSDIWPSNLLFSRHPTSRMLEFRALIDFQTASLTSPALDVACLLATCLSSKDRRAYKDEMLDRYYSKFSKCLNGLPIPYTRDQLESSYDLCLPAAVFLAFPFMSALSMKVGNAVPHESVDKMIGLIEDLITMHEENQQKFKNFYE